MRVRERERACSPFDRNHIDIWCKSKMVDRSARAGDKNLSYVFACVFGLECKIVFDCRRCLTVFDSLKKLRTTKRHECLDKKERKGSLRDLVLQEWPHLLNWYDKGENENPSLIKTGPVPLLPESCLGVRRLVDWKQGQWYCRGCYRGYLTSDKAGTHRRTCKLLKTISGDPIVKLQRDNGFYGLVKTRSGHRLVALARRSRQLCDEDTPQHESKKRRGRPGKTPVEMGHKDKKVAYDPECSVAARLQFAPGQTELVRMFII